MMAGQLLYGDDVSGALVEDTGDSSLVVELIRAIQEGEDLSIDEGARVFGIEQSEIVSDSPLGSPTARSEPILDIEDWLLRKHGMTLEEATQTRTKTREQEQPELQMALF
jgi:hypothetical protein